MSKKQRQEEQKLDRYQREQMIREAGGDPESPGEEWGEEEFAAEWADQPTNLSGNRQEQRNADEVRETPAFLSWGWGALAVSVLSLFLWPFALGITGIVLGFIANFMGARTQGIWAIVIGAVSVLSSLFLYPR